MKVLVTGISDEPIVGMNINCSVEGAYDIISYGGHDSSSSSVIRYTSEITILIQPVGDVTISATPIIERPSHIDNNRFLGIDADDGITIRVDGNPVTAVYSSGSEIIEVLSEESRNNAVTVVSPDDDSVSHGMIKQQSSDGLVTRMYVTIPAAVGDSDQFGTIHIAYADEGKSTPEYTIYLPECYDPLHPSTVVEYRINGVIVNPGLITLDDFSKLDIDIHSDKEIGEYNIKLRGTVSGGWYQFGPDYTAFTPTHDLSFSIPSGNSQLCWVEGNYILSIIVYYGDYLGTQTTSTATVNIDSDVVLVQYKSEEILDGEEIPFEFNQSLYVITPDDSPPGTIFYTSEWNAPDYSVWICGISHSDDGYQCVIIPTYNLDEVNSQHATGIISITWAAD